MLRDGNLLLELGAQPDGPERVDRAVRVPEGDLAKARGDGTSKSAVSRRFVALSRKKMKAGSPRTSGARPAGPRSTVCMSATMSWWRRSASMATATSMSWRGRGGDRRRPGLDRQSPRQGARSDTAAAVHRRWPKALSKAIRNTFGVACQVHKGRNIIERLPLHLPSVKKALRQAWDQDDADKAERLLRNLARRLEHEEPGVSGSILEGLDEILTVIRLGLPHELRRSLACTNIIENRSARCVRSPATSNAGGTPRCRAQMDRRRLAGGPEDLPSPQGLRQLPILRNALQEHLRKAHADSAIAIMQHSIINQRRLPHEFQQRCRHREQ